jgi:hypothetical protein
MVTNCKECGRDILKMPHNQEACKINPFCPCNEEDGHKKECCFYGYEEIEKHTCCDCGGLLYEGPHDCMNPEFSKENMPAKLFDSHNEVFETWIATNLAEINHKEKTISQNIFLNHDGIINLSVAITHDNYTRTHKFVMSAKDGSVLISETEK